MEALYLISGAFAGIIAGGVFSWLWTERRARAAISSVEMARALADQKAVVLAADIDRLKAEAMTRLAATEQQVEQLQRSHETATRELSVAQASVAEANALRNAAEKNVADAIQRLVHQEKLAVETDTVVAGLHRQMADIQSLNADLAARRDAAEKNTAEQKLLLDAAQHTLTNAFASLSRDALEKSNMAFLQMAQERFKTLSAEAAGSLEERKAQIGTLLKPLEEMLGTYQKRLAEMEGQRTGAYAELRQQIGAMSATQAALSAQTTHLVSALTRPNVRGQWGEIALRKLVELAGMSDRCDFSEQTTMTDEDGNRLRPDMIIHLPAGRRVVVDCKAVLGAFLDAASATDEAARHGHLLRHAGLIRARANDLAGKTYWAQFSDMPEFVVLFLPGESFLYAACEQDSTLLEDCIAKRVIIATPTTLIALLKSIEYGWRQQAVSENAEAIRDLGKQIYDRLATLGENMARLGKSLDNAVDHYNKSIGTLDSRVLVSARKMSELGARTEKEMPELPPVDKRTRELSGPLHPDRSPLLPD